MAQSESPKKANTKSFPKYGNNLGNEKEFHGKEIEKHNLLTTKTFGSRSPSKSNKR